MSANTAVVPRKWHLVYANDAECRIFKELARGKYEWRTIRALNKATNVPVKTIESICHKYIPLGMIHQHHKEPDKFRYWERATPKKKKGSVAEEDQKRRVDERVAVGTP